MPSWSQKQVRYFHLIISQQTPNVRALFCSRSRGYTALHLALLVGCIENIRALLDSGANLNEIGSPAEVMKITKDKPEVHSLITKVLRIDQ